MVATLPIKATVLMSIYLWATSLIVTASVYSIVEMNTNWTHEIGKYLQIGELVEDEKQAHKIWV